MKKSSLLLLLLPTLLSAQPKEYTCEEITEAAKEGWRTHAQARDRISYDYKFEYVLPVDLGQEFAKRRAELAEEGRRFWAFENTTTTGQVVKGTTCFDYSWRIADESGEAFAEGWFSDPRDPMKQLGLNPETQLVSYRFGDFFEGALDREVDRRECRTIVGDDGEELAVMWLHFDQEMEGAAPRSMVESLYFSPKKSWVLVRHEMVEKVPEGSTGFHIRTDFTVSEIEGKHLITGYDFTMPTMLWKKAYGRERLTLANMVLNADCP